MSVPAAGVPLNTGTAGNACTGLQEAERNGT